MTADITEADSARRRKPKTAVFNLSDEFISLHEVWIYPFNKMQHGARVLFFRANKEKKVLCYVYLEEPFVPDPASGLLGNNQSKQFVDGLCDIALKALAKKDVRIEEDFDVAISEGKLVFR